MKGIIVVILSTMFMAGCANHAPNKTENLEGEKVSVGSVDIAQVPEWYLQQPDENDDLLYSAATGIADDMQFAMAKALHSAKVILGDRQTSRVGAEFKHYISDSGTGGTGRASQESENVSISGFKNISVNGYKIEKQVVYKEGRNQYRAFVLLSLKRDVEYALSSEVIETEVLSSESQVRAEEAYGRLKW